MKRILPLLVALAFSGRVEAQDLRELCTDRPGLETAPCTVDAGHLQIEAAFADWTLDRRPDSRTDTILAGDFIARLGVADSLEARLGWTPFGHVRERDRSTGMVTRQGRVGDVALGIKYNLRNPDGSGLSLAVLPHVELPVGRMPVGQGTWSGGLTGAFSAELGEKLRFVASPEIAAAADDDGAGRHLRYGAEFGLTDGVVDGITVTADVELVRDREPDGHFTEALFGASLAWAAGPLLQFDVGSNVGLDHASPDAELYVGISRKF